jgi:hypothetical protein
MATTLKPATAPVSREIGRMRSIVPIRARDEELAFFMAMSRESLRVAGRYIRKRLRRA